MPSDDLFVYFTPQEIMEKVRTAASTKACQVCHSAFEHKVKRLRVIQDGIGRRLMYVCTNCSPK